MSLTGTLQDIAACAFGVCCSHSCDVASTRILLIDVKNQYRPNASLVPHIMQRVVMMFTMMQVYYRLLQRDDVTPWKAGALSGYISGLIASPLELYKVHQQSASTVPFATHLRSKRRYMFMVTKMACIRNMIFDSVFFHIAPDPRKLAVQDTAFACAVACCVHAPLSYATQLCMTESSVTDAMRRLKTTNAAQFAKNRAFATAEILSRLSAYTFAHVICRGGASEWLVRHF